MKNAWHPQEDTCAIWDESRTTLCSSFRESTSPEADQAGVLQSPKGKPIFVPGFHWFEVVITGFKGVACPAHFHWWTMRGETASKMRDKKGRVLKQRVKRWGSQVIHVWDRGFAGESWLLQAWKRVCVLFCAGRKATICSMNMESATKLRKLAARNAPLTTA